MDEELLTTKQLQEILKVDRTTIYRMADSGRIPAIKVGNQWRFPREQIEVWLWKQSAAAQAREAGPGKSPHKLEASNEARRVFPLECVQMIQDTYADLLGVMMIVTDMTGNPITQPSNACGLFTAAESSPRAHQRCLEHWVAMAGDPRLQPSFERSHLGLLCARGLIRVGVEIKGMLIVGGIAPENWPPSDAEIEEIASFLEVEPSLIRDHADEVFRISPQRQQELLPYVQRIADVLSFIATERNALIKRFDNIAELAKI
jgi:excisionase family DNA binding protein